MARKTKTKGSGLSGQALKDFRSKVAKLKKKGIVSKRVDARSQKATKYMQAKIRKFEGVLNGTEFAVKAPKAVRSKYTEAEVFKEIGGFLVGPKEHAKSRARIKKGRDLIEIVTPLKWGEKREVILPWKATNLLDFAHKIEENPDAFDELKNGDEQFAFYLYGNASVHHGITGRSTGSTQAFVNAQELVQHVLINYKHLFKGNAGRDAIKHFSLIRFKGVGDRVPDMSGDEEYYEPRFAHRKYNQTGRNSGPEGSYEKERRELYNMKRRKRLSQETQEQTAVRLARQRLRQAQLRQRRFDES